MRILIWNENVRQAPGLKKHSSVHPGSGRVRQFPWPTLLFGSFPEDIEMAVPPAWRHLLGLPYCRPAEGGRGWVGAREKSRLNKRDVALVENLLTRVFPIHHLLAWHGCRYKNSLFMQFPNNLDLYLGNSAWSR